MVEKLLAQRKLEEDAAGHPPLEPHAPLSGGAVAGAFCFCGFACALSVFCRFYICVVVKACIQWGR